MEDPSDRNETGTGSREHDAHESRSDRHYVWSDDRTRLEEKAGPIDMSQPFFLTPDEDPVAISPSVDWPEGWYVIGSTDG